METNPQKTKVRSKGASAGIVILGCLVIAHAFFYLYCGLGRFWMVGSEMSHFDEKGHPLSGNIFGTLYQGGFVIPIVMTLLLTVIALSVERFFALRKANGKGNVTQFVAKEKVLLADGDIAGAEALCDSQQGSVANVLKSALVRYKDVESYTDLNNDEKAEIIQKEIEDATTLELPYLEQNLPVVAAISSLGTLFGLLGTVLGMIKSFAAMGNEGAPDSTALAVGISEALMNTAMGIGTGAVAIIAYNYFTGKVKDFTDAVNEVGFAIGQTYTSSHKNK